MHLRVQPMIVDQAFFTGHAIRIEDQTRAPWRFTDEMETALARRAVNQYKQQMLGDHRLALQVGQPQRLTIISGAADADAPKPPRLVIELRNVASQYGSAPMLEVRASLHDFSDGLVTVLRRRQAADTTDPRPRGLPRVPTYRHILPFDQSMMLLLAPPADPCSTALLVQRYPPPPRSAGYLVLLVEHIDPDKPPAPVTAAVR